MNSESGGDISSEDFLVELEAFDRWIDGYLLDALRLTEQRNGNVTSLVQRSTT